MVMVRLNSVIPSTSVQVLQFWVVQMLMPATTTKRQQTTMALATSHLTFMAVQMSTAMATVSATWMEMVSARQTTSVRTPALVTTTMPVTKHVPTSMSVASVAVAVSLTERATAMAMSLTSAAYAAVQVLRMANATATATSWTLWAFVAVTALLTPTEMPFVMTLITAQTPVLVTTTTLAMMPAPTSTNAGYVEDQVSLTENVTATETSTTSAVFAVVPAQT